MSLKSFHLGYWFGRNEFTKRSWCDDTGNWSPDPQSYECIRKLLKTSTFPSVSPTAKYFLKFLNSSDFNSITIHVDTALISSLNWEKFCLYAKLILP